MKLDLSEIKGEHGYLIKTMTVTPPSLNSNNNLFGGQLMAWLDESAAMFAIMETGYPYMVTRAINHIEFKKPIFQGDLVHFFCKVDQEGSSSLTVKTTVMRQKLHGDGYFYDVYETPDIVTETSVVMVAVDPQTGMAHKWNHDV